MNFISQVGNTSSAHSTQAALVPYVVKRTPDGERAMDLFSRLLDERIIIVSEDIRDDLASTVVAQLLYLQSEDAEKDITMYINSGGGSVVSMWSMIDTMNLIKPDVSTVCTGMAASAASLMLAAGTKGKRFILPNARVMIHQPIIPQTGGQASDIEITAKQILKSKKDLEDFLAKRTGQKPSKLNKDMDRDTWLDAKESLDYGIVDKIIGQ